MDRTYKVVDVFTDRPLLGNPVAVVLDAEGLGGDAMQRIARWTNLSETTFVLPPQSPAADYRLRSGNGAIAAFRRARGVLPAASAAYVAAQGQCVGRDGRIAITVAGDGPITVGGSCVTVIDGVLRL